jgi:Ulp1 family protease
VWKEHDSGLLELVGDSISPVKSIVDNQVPLEWTKDKILAFSGDYNTSVVENVLVSSILRLLGKSHHLLLNSYTREIAPNNGWLDDAVITFYMMRMVPVLFKKEQLPTFKVFESCFFDFFLPSRGSYDYPRVQNWTKSQDIFSFELTFIPINHLNTHWAGICIKPELKLILYYDGFHSKDLFSKYSTAAAKYLDFEAKKLKMNDFDIKQWDLKMLTSADSPTQTSSVDCGIFVIMFFLAELHGGVTKESFTQENMNQYRQKLCDRILNEANNQLKASSMVQKNTPPLKSPLSQKSTSSKKKGIKHRK